MSVHFSKNCRIKGSQSSQTTVNVYSRNQYMYLYICHVPSVQCIVPIAHAQSKHTSISTALHWAEKLHPATWKVTCQCHCWAIEDKDGRWTYQANTFVQTVCLNVFEDPQMIDCKCGSNFCRQCIEKLKARRRTCALCNCLFRQNMSNRSLQRTINGLRVYCSFKESGCIWQGKLSKLSYHLNENPFEASRLLGCSFVRVNCVHCEEKYERGSVFEHERSGCLKRPYVCTQCNDLNMNRHMKTTETIT